LGLIWLPRNLTHTSYTNLKLPCISLLNHFQGTYVGWNNYRKVNYIFILSHCFGLFFFFSVWNFGKFLSQVQWFFEGRKLQNFERNSNNLKNLPDFLYMVQVGSQKDIQWWLNCFLQSFVNSQSWLNRLMDDRHPMYITKFNNNNNNNNNNNSLETHGSSFFCLYYDVTKVAIVHKAI
jgi:hypothetical protein